MTSSPTNPSQKEAKSNYAITFVSKYESMPGDSENQLIKIKVTVSIISE